MTMRLHLLCVASTPSIRSASFPSNDPLDAQGRKALEAFAGSLPPFDKTWTSPDVSAVQTAEILGLRPETDPMLRDCDFGRWSGRSLVDVQTTEPDALATWLGDPTSAPHGGESFVGVVKRVQSWMDGLHLRIRLDARHNASDRYPSGHRQRPWRRSARVAPH